WANRSSPPPSGVMKPKPFASLNHLTVPVGMFSSPNNQEKKSGHTRPMFRSQGQESTALRQLPTSRTGRALVLEIKHNPEYTRGRPEGQTAVQGENSAAQFASHQPCPRAQRPQFGARDVPRQGHHAAVGAGIYPFRRHERERGANGRGDLFRALYAVGRDIDRADQHILALQQPDELERDVRVGAFERDLVNGRACEQRERMLVLPPLAPE